MGLCRTAAPSTVSAPAGSWPVVGDGRAARVLLDPAQAMPEPGVLAARARLQLRPHGDQQRRRPPDPQRFMDRGLDPTLISYATALDAAAVGVTTVGLGMMVSRVPARYLGRPASLRSRSPQR